MNWYQCMLKKIIKIQVFEIQNLSYLIWCMRAVKTSSMLSLVLAEVSAYGTFHSSASSLAASVET